MVALIESYAPNAKDPQRLNRVGRFFVERGTFAGQSRLQVFDASGEKMALTTNERQAPSLAQREQGFADGDEPNCSIVAINEWLENNGHDPLTTDKIAEIMGLDPGLFKGNGTGLPAANIMGNLNKILSIYGANVSELGDLASFNSSLQVGSEFFIGFGLPQGFDSNYQLLPDEPHLVYARYEQTGFFRKRNELVLYNYDGNGGNRRFNDTTDFYNRYMKGSNDFTAQIK